jgi:hypothetical protein
VVFSKLSKGYQADSWAVAPEDCFPENCKRTHPLRLNERTVAFPMATAVRVSDWWTGEPPEMAPVRARQVTAETSREHLA